MSFAKEVSLHLYKMGYRYELFKTEQGGYGFIIYKDEVPIFIQEFKPYSTGFEPMTEEEARKYAEELIRYYENIDNYGSSTQS